MRVPSKLLTARRLVLFRTALIKIPKLSSTKKKRIAIVTGELEVGGVGRVLLNMIQALPSEAFEIFIFTTDPRLNNWAPEFKKHTKHVIDIPLTIGMHLPQRYVQKYLETYVSKNKMDVIFITNSSAGYQALPIVRSSGASSNANIYDLLHTYGRPSDDDAFLKISMPFDKLITKRLVISNYLKNYYVSHYPVDANRVAVIYNGIDEMTANYTADLTYGRTFLGLKSGEKAITYLGRLQEDKSPDRLVELAGLLKDDLKKHNAFIAIVGEGSLEESLRTRAHELKVLDTQVRFFPFTAQPIDVCAASYFTILTSDLEGIPMSVLESMQVRTPVIAPKVGGLPDIIDDQRDGFLANFTHTNESQKLQALRKAILEALALDDRARQNMGKLAHKKVHAKFTSMGLEYLHLFDD